MITILCNTTDGVLIQFGHGRRTIVSAEVAEDYIEQGQVLEDLR